MKIVTNQYRAEPWGQDQTVAGKAVDLWNLLSSGSPVFANRIKDIANTKL
jgi:hypothetical protein